MGVILNCGVLDYETVQCGYRRFGGTFSLSHLGNSV